MKVIEAKERLSNYNGNELYSQARQLYEQETDSRISLRSHGKPVSRGVIESVVTEMKPWMERVGAGLSWNDNEILYKMIEWETGATWVRYGMTDPRVEQYAKFTRLEILRGTPYPALSALNPESLDAMSSMMLAQLTKESRQLFGEDEKK